MARTTAGAGTTGTRSALLAAARSRFATVGFDRARLTDLCADAALTTGALYRNFSSKEALLDALVSDLEDDLGARPRSGDAREVAGSWLVVVRRHRGAYRALVERALTSGEPDHARRRIRHDLATSLEAALPSVALAPEASLVAADTLEYAALAESLGWMRERPSGHIGATLAHLLLEGVHGGAVSRRPQPGGPPPRRRTSPIAPVLRWTPGPGRAVPGSQRGRAQVDAILDAAEASFAELGVGGTTVATIAARAGVSSGTVYRYFTDKVDVLACLLVRVEQNLYESAVLDIDEWGRFDALDGTVAYLHAHQRHVGVFRAWRELAVSGHELARAWVDMRREFARGIEGVVSDGVRRGVVDPALDGSLVGDLVVGMFEQSAHVRHELGWNPGGSDGETATIIARALGTGIRR